MNKDMQCQDNTPKGWSNQVGYGHVVQAQIVNGQVKAQAHPWNRIQPLSNQANTLVDTNSAWSPPISSELEAQLNASCNLCQDGNPKQCSYQGIEHKEYSPLV